MPTLPINKGINKLGSIFYFLYIMNSNYVLRIPLPLRLIMYFFYNSSSSSGGRSLVDLVAKAVGVP